MPNDTEGDYNGINPNGWDYAADNDTEYSYRRDGHIIATINKSGGEWHGHFMGAFGIVAPNFETVFRAIQGKLIEYGY